MLSVWEFLASREGVFMVNLILSASLGYLIGAEREFRKKDAGISTHILVISGAMMFTYMSSMVDPDSQSRIAAQIVSGVGFLGAGLILKDSEGDRVRNLTTASSIWFCAAVGMAIGYQWYAIAVMASFIGLIVPRIPRVGKEDK